MSGTRSASPKAPVTEPDWARTTLLLVAHGIEGELGMADALRRSLTATGRFGAVRAACHKGYPDLADVLDELSDGPIVVAPLLMAEGWTLEAIRARLAGHRRGRDCLLAPAIGSHPELWRLVQDRALARCSALGWRPAQTTLLLAAHGTLRHPGAALSAKDQAERLAELGLFADVRLGFLDQAPYLDEVVAGFGPRPAVAAGFFFDNGPHGRDDVSEALTAGSGPVAYLGALGADAGILPYLLDRVRLARPLPIVA